MKTKAQKTKEVHAGKELLEKSQNLVFTDFTGVGVALIEKLKRELKKNGAQFKVIKKRLLRVALGQKGIEFDTKQFQAQLGTIFLPGELSESAGIIYKFTTELKKENKEFRILGAYDLSAKNLMSAEDFLVIAKLPSREILLGQLVGVLTGPIRAFMYLVSELAKREPQSETTPQSEGITATAESSGGEAKQVETQ